MRKNKFLFILLTLSILSILFYQNYIYYLRPYNPFHEFAKAVPRSFHFSENHANDIITRSTHDINTTTLIFKYFNDLNLIPLKKNEYKDEINKYQKDIYPFLSGMLVFDLPSHNTIFINEIYLDNLTILYISSDKPDFHDGYYKIIDSKLEYKHINDLIGNSQN